MLYIQEGLTMLSNRWIRIIVVALVSTGLVGIADAQLNRQQATRIEAAVPKKARVAPKRPRRVLIAVYGQVSAQGLLRPAGGICDDASGGEDRGFCAGGER